MHMKFENSQFLYMILICMYVYRVYSIVYIYNIHITITSSTAQGGGGSFKIENL